MATRQAKNNRKPVASDLLKWAIVIIVFSVLITILAQMKPSTRTFVKEVSITNEFELESSKIALQKSQTPAVRQFAEQMIREHTELNAEFKAALDSSNNELKTAVSGLDKKHEKIIKKLNETSGDEFDKEYLEAQENGHKKAESLFRKYSEKGEDAALQDFAEKNHGVIKKHLDHVKNIKL